MRARPNTLILFDGSRPQAWSPRSGAFAALPAEAVLALCRLQAEPGCAPGEAERAALDEAGLLVADDAHFDYPEKRVRTRPLPEPGPPRDADSAPLVVSPRTLLRFTSDTIYAWAPDVPLRRYRQRYDRQVRLDPGACAVLLAHADPSGRDRLLSGMAPAEAAALAARLHAAGILTSDPPAPRARPPGARFSLSVPAAEPVEPATAKPPGASTGSREPTAAERLGNAGVTCFFTLVFLGLIVPLACLRRLSPRTRRERARDRASAWRPCRTLGLQDPDRYRLPF